MGKRDGLEIQQDAGLGIRQFYVDPASIRQFLVDFGAPRKLRNQAVFLKNEVDVLA